MREINEVPVLSEAVRRLGVPLSLATRGAGPMEFDIEIEAAATA